MLGSIGLDALSASLSTAIFAYSVGKFGRISFMQPAGMFLFADVQMQCLRVIHLGVHLSEGVLLQVALPAGL